MSVSVCIPCTEKHIIYLKDCINSIYNQTTLPENVIISISGITNNIDDTKKIVDNIIEPFTDKLVFIITYNEKILYAGENRNIAISKSDADYICLIDADDMMHNSRIEIITKIFDKFPKCDIILHHFIKNPDSNLLEKNNQKIDFCQNLLISYHFSYKLHFGHCCFRKNIFKKYQYTNKPRGQDVEFIQNFIVDNKDYYNKMFIYEYPLTFYYYDRSSYSNKMIK
jgi:glycosyltransferase involved in cell wall biosynthesis